MLKYPKNYFQEDILKKHYLCLMFRNCFLRKAEAWDFFQSIYYLCHYRLQVPAQTQHYLICVHQR